ncbi:anthranilate phosphoribosyltransferase [Porticoccus litoralis]|jgi:anthranilate phosphoribosyltransferase|uniref:Anthranilate phosphoribosyltransferase n=1 Tax=Porticoccus litoralis TaxID=434086 RepID=A0AAW8B398_9GAMM|nr:anthranilate phosphoribosyltransferase [Porticoccus litoralis]MDP1520892.1 anthranilate phosphoribosyltransferase [Porticoccus litoralis]TNE87509.1 MAG: anthranilate phosphoribosyltransferase [Gammaproteobacteria bacterium]
MNIQQAIAAVLQRQDLSIEDMREVMRQIMTGDATDAQIGGFLVGLRMKGETVSEITAAAQVMRELAAPVSVGGEHLVDIVGTGGDSAGIFNVSTASTFVAAAAGARVAKHGNRSVSSKSGSADLLEAAGVCLDLSPAEVARCVEEVGVGFMFAVNHHSAMKHAIGPRRELAARTLFNLLGPLTNPARIPNMLLGVFDREWVRPVAEVMRELGAEHVLVVHSADGLDEISIAAETWVAELLNGEILEYTVVPEDFNIARGHLQDLKVVDADESLAMVKRALSKDGGTASDMVALNAGAALYAAGVATSLAEGVGMAQDAIGSGLAKAKLDDLAAFSRCLKELDTE